MNKHEKPCQNFCLNLGASPDAPCHVCGHLRAHHSFVRWSAVEHVARYPPPDPAMEHAVKFHMNHPFTFPAPQLVGPSAMEDKTYSIPCYTAKEWPTVTHFRDYIIDAVRTEAVPKFTYTAFTEVEEGSHLFKELLDSGQIIESHLTVPAIHGQSTVRLTHALMGMSSEIDEYYEATEEGDDVGVMEELGDIMWYWAIAIDVACLDPWTIRQMGEMLGGPPIRRTLVTYERVEKDLVRAISRFGKVVKPYIMYNRRLDDAALKVCLAEIVRHVQDLLILRSSVDADPHELMRTMMGRNIAKLRKRFPEKYTDAKANNRDVVAERKVLEGRELAESVPCNHPEHCTVPSHEPLHQAPNE